MGSHQCRRFYGHGSEPLRLLLPGHLPPDEGGARRCEGAGAKLGGGHGGWVIDGTLGAEAVRKSADAFAAGVTRMLRQMQGDGLSLRQMAARSADKGIKTPRGGAWTAAAVRIVLARV